MLSRLKLTTDNFIEKAKQVHGDLYLYSKVTYIKAITNVIIICKIHGEFKQQARHHISGHGCRKCRDHLFSMKRRDDVNIFLDRCKDIHKDRFDYSKVKYVSVDKPVIIICKIHGQFFQTPANHLAYDGCRQCSDTQPHTTESFIAKANKIHNNKYTYEKAIYNGAKSKVIITCAEHGDFPQAATSHLSGNGCPKCVGYISKIETQWLDSLGIKYRNISIKIGNKYIKPDGFDPETNTIYEMYGDYFHGNPRKFNQTDINPTSRKSYGFLYNRTMEREKLIINAGYKLITIWECDFRATIKNT